MLLKKTCQVSPSVIEMLRVFYMKIYFLSGLMVIGLLSNLFSHRIVRQIEDRNIHLARALATFFANVPANPSATTAELIRHLTHNLSFPVIGVDLENKIRFRITVDSKGRVEIFNRDEDFWISGQGKVLPVSVESIKKARVEIEKMCRQNDPIPVLRQETIDGPLIFDGYLFYGQSYFVTRLRRLPLIVTGLTAIFFLSGLLFYRRLKHSQQRAIWVGMAKETAHQLGTPLSSLWGWLELLKSENCRSENEESLQNIQSDLERLDKVASRFGRIGAAPELKNESIRQIIENITDYYRKRLPKYGKEVEVITDFSDEEITIEVDRDLLEWVFENLIKNSFDAFEGNSGTIIIKTEISNKDLFISVKDNGIGMSAQTKRRIFDPGFSTKKRGWGLGLALAARIIEEYHGGRLKVIYSELGSGTTIGIWLPGR